MIKYMLANESTKTMVSDLESELVKYEITLKKKKALFSFKIQNYLFSLLYSNYSVSIPRLPE